MSEVIEQTNETVEQPTVDTPAVDETQTSDEPQLPSDQPIKQDLSTLTDGLEDIVKDGMIGGKFKTVADMMASYQELEGKYANARRELTGGEQEQQEQQQTVQKQQEVINGGLADH